MAKAKAQYRFIISGIWMLLSSVAVQSQSMPTHAAFFEAALRARTPEQAAFYTQQACDAALTKGKSAVAVEYNLRMTNVFFRQSHYLSGIRQAQRGLASARHYKLSADTTSFKYYSLLASMYSRLTMTDSAGYWYGHAEQLLQRNARLPTLISAYIEAYYYNKGYHFMRLGDQVRAAEYIHKSVEMARRTGSGRSAALSYLQLANYYFSIFDYKQAAVYYQTAQHGFSPQSVDACWGYALLGNCFRASGRLADGLKLLQLGQRRYAALVSQKRAAADSDFEVESSYYRAMCEERMGIDQAADRSYQICINTARDVYGDRGEFVAASLTGQATIAFRKGQVGKALELVQKAIIASTVLFKETNPEQNPAADDIKAGKALYQALHLKGQVWVGIYRKNASAGALVQAVDTYRTSLQVAQRIRRSFTRLESTYFFNEAIYPCVEHALEAMTELQSQSQSGQQSALLFELLQAYHAMGLADALHEKAVKHETIPAKTLQLEQNLRQDLIAAESRLLSQSATAEQLPVVARIGSLKRQLYFFEDTLARAFPRYHALKYTSRQVPLKELQRKLDDETAYVSYFTGERFIYGFFVTRFHVRLFRRIVTPAYTQAILDLRQALAYNPGMFDYEGRPAANRLFDYLISPIESQLHSVRRLIIERDGLLNNIPFEVLEPAGQPEAYLCKRVALSYSYSAKLTFSDSVTTGPVRPACFAPYSDDSAGRVKSRVSSQVLRHSAAEVRQVGGYVYLNGQATKEQFLRGIRRANLLHLATHATADDAHPEMSSISFYPDNADSLLRALELVNLPLEHTRLVVLSACAGNSGTLRRAEGLLSLARAFRLAGCPTILTTTWSAHNETTSEQVRLFYTHLHRGMPADVALQQARLDFFASPMCQKWGHPYYWANFTLIGDPSVAFPAAQSSVGWTAALSGLLISSLLLIFFFRRVRSQPARHLNLPANLPPVD